MIYTFCYKVALLCFYLPYVVLKLNKHMKLLLILRCHVFPDTSLVDGGWGPWSVWSNCSQPCGNETRTRTRACVNPLPAYGGRLCFGNLSEDKSCRQQECQGGATIKTEKIHVFKILLILENIIKIDYFMAYFKEIRL